jgi:hypothetical protein
MMNAEKTDEQTDSDKELVMIRGRYFKVVLHLREPTFSFPGFCVTGRPPKPVAGVALAV